MLTTQKLQAQSKEFSTIELILQQYRVHVTPLKLQIIYDYLPLAVVILRTINGN